MLNKSEMNLLNKLMESSIECKMEAYKMLREDLMKIQQQIAQLLGTKEVKYVAPVTEDIKPEIKETVEQPKVETKEQPKKETKTSPKVSDPKKLIKCGPSEGDDAVLFIEKRRDDKNLWYGQIRINNTIRNFHWSNQLEMPVVYGIENTTALKEARALIRTAVKEIAPKELTLYDKVPDHPEFGGFKGRQFIGAIDQGSYIYLSPDFNDGTQPDDIIAKGYTNDHAFIIRRDAEVYWKKYDYIFSKKGFEKTPHKGYDVEVLMNNVNMLADAVFKQYEQLSSAYYRKQSKTTKEETNKITKDEANEASTGKLKANSLEEATTMDLGALF